MLSIALKEWHFVISRILAGRQAILLRKGGILEADNQFELEHHRFLWFPTFIHQDPRMLKPQFRQDIIPAAAEPAQIEIRGYAQAAAIFQVPSRPQMDALSDLHPWEKPFLDMRFAYRPEKPLYLLVVRPFLLPKPILIPNTLEFAGCKSWVPLPSPLNESHSTQVLSEPHLQSLLSRIRQTFSPTH